MKKLFVFIAFVLTLQSSFAALSVQVDERADLLSIVCRLAEYQEYVNNSVCLLNSCKLAESQEYANNDVKNYRKDIDSYFAPYVTLSLIDYAKEIRKTNGISYDAIALLIPYMEIKNRKMHFSIDAFEVIPEKDQRWNREMLSQFAVLLNEFYKKTNFNRFFNKHTALYRITETQFNEIVTSQLNLSWFDDTFGVVNTNFHIVLSLCNGPHNYGPSNGKEDYYAIIGVNSVDSLGLPYFDNEKLQIVIHEFSHSYCNPVCNKYKDDMQPIFDALFPYVVKYLDNAYTQPQTLIYENLTRLITLLYLSNQQTLGTHHVRVEEQSGFPWMEDLLFFCNNFTKNRDIYTDFISFIPDYIFFMNGITGQIEKIICAYESKIPRIVSVFPQNGNTVSSKIKEVQIMFNVPMINALSIEPLDENPENRVSPFWPPLHKNYLSYSRRIIIVPIEELKENTKYGTTLTKWFLSEGGYHPNEEYVWIFDTK